MKITDSELNAYSVYLGIISKDFVVENIRKTGLNGYVFDFSVDYANIDTDDTLDIHKYLTKKNNIK